MSDSNCSYKKYIVIFDTTDVTDAVNCVNIYYDVHSPVISANILMTDSTDLLEKMNLTSGEVTVTLEFSCIRNGREFEVRQEMVLHSIRDKVQLNQKTMMYTAVCVSSLFKTLNTTRVRQNLIGKANLIIKSLVQQNAVGVTVVAESETDNSINAGGNNELLGDVVARLIKMSTQNGKAAYIFYQTNYKECRLETISDLQNRQSGLSFYYRLTSTSDYRMLNETNRHIVRKYEVIHPTPSENDKTGYNGTTSVTYDIMNKRQTNKEVNNQNKVDTTTSNSPQASKQVMVAATGIQDNSKVLDNPALFRTSRMSELMRLEQEKVLIQVQGHCDLHLYLGMTSDLELPVQSDTKTFAIDPKRSGEYIITAVEDSFNRQYYITNLELTKLKLEGQ